MYYQVDTEIEIRISERSFEAMIMKGPLEFNKCRAFLRSKALQYECHGETALRLQWNIQNVTNVLFSVFSIYISIALKPVHQNHRLIRINNQ